MWLQNVSIVVADVKEVFSFFIRSEERFFPISEEVVTLSLFAKVLGFLAQECGVDSLS